ncbi:carbonic anhydrase 6-like [Phlebotomus papatasi]|uniref:carbonic anhydrase 6-like n=1 Tax=Phlebotomus papatasi TaxID=29031 RepID=UPI0024839102|nr:carbonic anhydrase 6-like [Phlebotomus papatasi]
MKTNIFAISIIVFIKIMTVYCFGWAPSHVGICQSPIDIRPETCIREHPSTLELQNFDVQPNSMLVENNGYTVQFSFEFGQNAPYINTQMQNALKVYKLAQLHFHIGDDDYEGSEHTIDEMYYSFEIHLVFFNSAYHDATAATSFHDGLLVLSILFLHSDYAQNLPFTEYLHNAKYSGEKYFVANNLLHHRLIDFIRYENFQYVRYAGSLTTPSYAETVTWFVSTDIRFINEMDLRIIRGIEGDAGLIAGNMRPVQPNNGRKCYKNY